MSLSASLPVNSAATPTGVSADANQGAVPEGGISVFDILLQQIAAETPAQPEAVVAPAAEAPVATADVTAAVLVDALKVAAPKAELPETEAVEAEDTEVEDVPSEEAETEAAAAAAQVAMMVAAPVDQPKGDASEVAPETTQPAIAIDTKAWKPKSEKTFTLPLTADKDADKGEAENRGSIELPAKETAEPVRVAVTKADAKDALTKVRDAVTGTDPQPAQVSTDPRTVSAAAPDASSTVTPSAFSLQAVSDTSTSYNATGASTTAASNLSKAAVESLSALSMQISKKLEQGSTKFAIELYPADLGKVEVSLHIARDGKTTAHLTFDSPVTAASFSAGESELRQQLADAGVSVDKDALSFSSRDGGGSFGSAMAQDQQQSQARQATRAMQAANKVADDSDLNAALNTAMQAMRTGASTLALNLIV